MRSNKRFTNTTFTHRVDHEAGRHRTRRAPKEPAVCVSCRSVYSGRRWRTAGLEGELDGVAIGQSVRKTICPACIQTGAGAPSGYLYVEGAFVAEHTNEIKQLLNNEAERASEDNPLGRIVTWQLRSSDSMLLTTTTEHLAQRLGHALNKAYDGRVEYDFSHENKLARVTWRRNLQRPQG